MGYKRPLNGGLPCTCDLCSASKLQHRDISPAAPSSNDILAWNATTSVWEPTAPSLPGAHNFSHEDGGSDEILVTGLSGELADPQPPKVHSSSHENGGLDEISVVGLNGVLADAQNANKLQSRVLAATAPTSNQTIVWNTGTSQWEPKDVSNKNLNLCPEFPGAVLYPDGVNNDCTITSGHDQTNHHNYYEITATSAPNDYDIVVQIRVPSDLVVWSETKLYAWTDDKDNNLVAVEIFDTGGNSDGSDTITPSANSTWQEKTLTTPAGTYAADGLMHIHIKGTIGVANKKIRIGPMKFKYTT